MLLGGYAVGPSYFQEWNWDCQGKITNRVKLQYLINRRELHKFLGCFVKAFTRITTCKGAWDKINETRKWKRCTLFLLQLLSTQKLFLIVFDVGEFHGTSLSTTHNNKVESWASRSSLLGQGSSMHPDLSIEPHNFTILPINWMWCTKLTFSIS